MTWLWGPSWVWITVGVLAAFGLLVAVVRRENRHDDDLEEDPFAEVPHPGFADLGTRPPEIAHELAPFPPAALPPPAPPPEGANYTGGPRPGTAAAAGQSGTHPCPPPLPNWAPGTEPFTAWDPTTPGSDEFVLTRIAAQNGNTS